MVRQTVHWGSQSIYVAASTLRVDIKANSNDSAMQVPSRTFYAAANGNIAVLK